jgi:hypothetical protein
LVSEQHLDFELKRHFRERGRLGKEKELPVYVACCERASNSMRLCVNELGERAKREGKKPPPGRRPRTTTTEVWSARLHMCVLNSRKTQAKVSFCIATGSVVILSGNLGRGWKYNADSGERLEENIMYKEAIGQKDALWSYFGGNTKVHAQQLSANYTHKHEQG